jgi:hypothetical protein
MDARSGCRGSRLWKAAGAALAALLLAGGVSGCKPKPPAGPTREQLTSLLQQEAQAMKATGEQLDPVLRVKATWTVSELSVHERPGDADRPWAGVIRFHIRAETKDAGSVQVDELDKRFDYLWSSPLQRWLIQPAAP